MVGIGGAHMKRDGYACKSKDNQLQCMFVNIHIDPEVKLNIPIPARLIFFVLEKGPSWSSSYVGIRFLIIDFQSKPISIL